MAQTEHGRCPYLIPAAVELWRSPKAGYCRRPGHRAHMPPADLLGSVCLTPAYGRCPGYAATMERRARAMTHADDETCPHLVYALSDRLWLYPTRGYCHRPGGRIFVPACATLDRVCTTAAHRECPGYQATTEERREP